MTALRTTTARHWDQLEAQRVRIAAHRTEANARHGRAVAEVDACADARDSAPLPIGATDGEIAAAADRRAARMGERIAGLSAAMLDGELLTTVNDWLTAMGARAFLPACRWVNKLRGVLARVQAPEWWRRQLRRDVIRRTEAERISAGRVNALAGEWYVSNEQLLRRVRQVKRNGEIMERTELENDLGEVWSVKALADKGPANKAIRRGELMTRIRGCEEWAEVAGHPGVFLTLSAPSRFHSTLHKTGKRNPLYSGATPRDAQDWLCARWAVARSALKREGVEVYGFRVAEPHHDGCPHWHALLWCEGGTGKAVKLIERAWLAPIDPKRMRWVHAKGCSQAKDRDHALFFDHGAKKHRVKAKAMTSGDAAGYVAKYIAKNIDDEGSVGTEGHRDEWAPDQAELFENGALRVEAWATAWGIRQFQGLGQPPVTVWRELRRVPIEAAEDAAPRLQYALDAVNRRDEDRADWATYLQAQGGTNKGREYVMRIALKVETVEGRFETIDRATPLGVYEAGAPETLVQSVRRTWKPREGSRGSAPMTGSAAVGTVAVKGMPSKGDTVRQAERSRSAPPWTRVNNCTRPGPGRWLDGLGISLAMPLEGWAGGLLPEEISPWAHPKPSPSASPRPSPRPMPLRVTP